MTNNLTTSAMSLYELTVLIYPDHEAELETIVQQHVRAVIMDAGGVIVSEDNWGKKKLAYRIAHQDFAIYVNFELNLPEGAALKIANTFNITDPILRYLLFRASEQGLQQHVDGEAA